MSVTDGGSFKCYQHDKIYETVDPHMWHEHIHDGNHFESGSAPCAVCGTTTHFELKTVGKKPICDKCKKDLTT